MDSQIVDLGARAKFVWNPLNLIINYLGTVRMPSIMNERGLDPVQHERDLEAKTHTRLTKMLGRSADLQADRKQTNQN